MNRGLSIRPAHRIWQMHFFLCLFSYNIIKTLWCKPVYLSEATFTDRSCSNCIVKNTENSFKEGAVRTQWFIQPFITISAWAKEQNINLRKSLSSKFRALAPRWELESEPHSCWVWEPPPAPYWKHCAQPEVMAGFTTSDAELGVGGPLQ